LIDRAKKLERYDLATEVEPGRWTISEQAEPTLKALGERNHIIKAMHRALTDHDLADERGPAQYAMHGQRCSRSPSSSPASPLESTRPTTGSVIREMMD
jgi:type IV secretory pathway VirD2 relaxase